MVKLVNFSFILLTFSILSNVCQREVVAKASAWNKGGDDTKAYNASKKIKSLTDKLEDIFSVDEDKTGNIVNLINKLQVHLDDLSDDFTEGKVTIKEAALSLKNFISIAIEINEFQKVVNEIKSRYDRLKLFSQNVNVFENSTKKSFAEWNVIPSSESINSKLFKMFFIYLGYQSVLSDRFGKVPLIDKIALEFRYEETHNLCPTVSAQQFLMNDFLEMFILEIKGYIINKYSWTILRSMSGISFKSEEDHFRNEYRKRSLFLNQKFNDVMKKVGREIRTCDPHRWEENVNYERLTRVVQGYITNEASINKFECKYDCQSISNAEMYGCYEDSCLGDYGTGNIIMCESDTKKDFINICHSDNPARRYEYFENNRGYKYNNNFYGKRSSCTKEEMLVKSWSTLFYNCSYCFCLLEDTSEKSDRFFNLRQVLSDIEENKVVTGVRFMKRNRVMYLQIQQGKLEALGSIKKHSLNWKRVEEYELEKEKNGVDYITLTNRYNSIGLDNIIFNDTDYVVTGVRLNASGPHIRLDIRGSKYNFAMGTLDLSPNSHKWISNDRKHEVKFRLRGVEPNRGPKVSTNFLGKSVPSTKYNVVEFIHSDKKDDASQTTLPFFDSQDVVSQAPTPLSGVGLYHKGFKGYGGFVAAKIFTLDTFNNTLDACKGVEQILQ